MRLKQIILLLLIILIQNNLNADIITELAKRDSQNPIRLTEKYSAYVLYTKNGYFHTEYRNDGFGGNAKVAATTIS